MTRTANKDQLAFFTDSSVDSLTKVFYDDPYYSQILNDGAFKRLHDVSFMGSIDYTVHCTQPKPYRSRATHSINVAYLAMHLTEKRGYSIDLKKHLVTAALLHDIGHPPLSHSVEPYLQKSLDLNHHKINNEIITGGVGIGKKLNAILSKYVDVNFVSRLINQESTEEGSDLFNNPINIDTIDGIMRAYGYVSKDIASTSLQLKLKVAEAAFLGLEHVEGKWKMLDSFWEKKDYVYSLLINSHHGLVSDKTSETYFEEFGKNISKDDIYKSEKCWHKKYPDLFLTFKKIKDHNIVPEWLCGETTTYKSRQYMVNTVSRDAERYLCKKTASTYTFRDSEPTVEQMKLCYL